MIVITGPTASGKTRLGVGVAEAIGGEIVSADSRQVYRGMDLGTGKDLDEYGKVSHHLIDICPAGTKYNLYQWLRDARAACDDISALGMAPIVCGGTGLYIESLLNGLDLPEVPENPALRSQLRGLTLAQLTEMLASMKPLHNTTDVDTCARAIRAIEIQTFYSDHPDLAGATQPHPVADAKIIGVAIDREERRRRIALRLDQRLRMGMVEEVKHLLDEGIDPDDLIYYGLEYKYLTLHCIGQLTFDQMRDKLLTAIQQFAKRQMTWFRGMERRGHKIHWIEHDDPDFVAKAIAYIRS